MDYETLKVSRKGDVLAITLDRPEKMNAINVRMLEELADVFSGPALEARAVLLAGGERAFCAGQDLTDDGFNVPRDAGEVLEKFYNPLIIRIAEFPRPVVASVRGAAAGAGFSLALAADIVIASETARFDMAFVRIGLVPDCGATYALPRLAGSARARALTMLGEPISGATAAEWGLIWKAVPDAETDAAALDIATRLAAGPTQALTMLKSALAASQTATLEIQLGLERELQVKAANTEDFAEGVAAFREKRSPAFKGR